MAEKYSDPTIRRAEAEDVDALLPLFAGYLRFYGRPVDEARIFNFLLDRVERAESVVFLAWEAGRAIGFTQLYPAFASLSQARSWILNDLFVAESHRGTGVARALLATAADFGRETGAVELMLQTARDNDTAQRLYTALGWVRDDHYLVYTLKP
jgi:GNAT superfamily N-acetyltransferase